MELEMAQTVTKEEFLSETQQAYSEWQVTLQKVDTQDMSTPLQPEGWSVKDLIAHITWYEREMVTVVNKLKKAFPKAGIVLISIHDKSQKKGSKLETDPVVLKLLEAQKNIVRKTKIAFWNLFESMGGKNSMPKWVAANPPLASKDHIHFNGQGAEKVADMFTEALLNAYKKYSK